MTAVELRGVEVAYDGKPVVADLDLEVPTGSWLALVGPNGAGKTTILRAIAGLVAHQGHVALCGEPVARLRPRDLARRVAVVRQEPIMPAGMSVAQYVLLGRSAHLSYFGRESRADRVIVGETLDQLSLTGFAARTLDSLSGGERRRAAIARALAQQAPVLLVDEPTSALDVGRQQEVLDLIEDARRERDLTVIAAMHDLTLAGQYADRLALIVGGRLVRCGTPRDVLTEAAIAGTYRARVRVRPVGEAVRAVVPVPREAPRGVRAIRGVDF